MSEDLSKKTDLFSLMRVHTAEEREILKEEINRDGQIHVPVVEDEEGNIIDGYLRVELWQELRDEGYQIADYTRDIRPGLTQVEKRVLRRSLNIARRHLSAEDRRKLIEDQIRDTPEYTDRRIAKMLGLNIDHKTVALCRERLESTGEIPHLDSRIGEDGKKRSVTRKPSISARSSNQANRARTALQKVRPDNLPAKDIDVKRLEFLERRQRYDDNKNKTPDPSFSLDGIDLRVGDCAVVLEDVPDGSVNLFLADPPYSKECVQEHRVYDVLGRLGARKMHPDGLLLSYAGNLFLPQTLADLGQHLEYRCLIAMLYNGPKPMLHQMKIVNHWKPLLAYRRKDATKLELSIHDIINKFDGPEKEYHEWQQSLAQAIRLILRHTQEGDLVCDPFLGSGTTALACYVTKRRFVGCDIVPGWVAVAQERLNDHVKEAG